jgi:hypothetical protein
VAWLLAAMHSFLRLPRGLLALGLVPVCPFPVLQLARPRAVHDRLAAARSRATIWSAPTPYHTIPYPGHVSHSSLRPPGISSHPIPSHPIPRDIRAAHEELDVGSRAVAALATYGLGRRLRLRLLARLNVATITMFRNSNRWLGEACSAGAAAKSCVSIAAVSLSRTPGVLWQCRSGPSPLNQTTNWRSNLVTTITAGGTRHAIDGPPVP